MGALSDEKAVGSSMPPGQDDLRLLLGGRELLGKILYHGAEVEFNQTPYCLPGSAIGGTPGLPKSPREREAAHFHGTGSMKKMQNTLTEAIQNLEHDMFKQAKAEVLRKFRDLEQHIKDALESGLQRAILLLSETDKIKLDVLEDIKELENILQQLCD